ncbi:MAG: Alanine racemase [Bacteroidetes bacterium ADurb.Bin217]|nr:MAG: Alanine racemase [Bacteroidetes bacterium ADurb.Bin217]
MFAYSVSDICSITQSTCVGNPSSRIDSVYIDSKTIPSHASAVFIAIVGAKHNGHSFISELYHRGVRNFWVQLHADYPLFDDATYIISEHPIHALQLLMAHYRGQFSIPIVGITGSNGKTIVKEWLYTIAKHYTAIARSPRSYNSQIGVPLSLTSLDTHHTIGLFEAGISQPNEMSNIELMLKPSIGIFTNIGDAHQEHFVDIEHKVAEKMKLFASVSTLIYCKDYELIHKHAQNLAHTILHAWSCTDNSADIFVTYSSTKTHTTITLRYYAELFSFDIPFCDKASIENAVHCCIAGLVLELPKQFLRHFETLPQVAMRLEQKSGKHSCTIINDSYNSDLQSLTVALQFLSQQNQHPNKTLILSDLKQTGTDKQTLYSHIASLIQSYGISKCIGIGHDVQTYLKPHIPKGLFFNRTIDFLEAYPTLQFHNEAILLKAAREFEFETIAKKLEFQTHQTVLEINLNAILYNLQYFRSYLDARTKVMVMVKAFSYGSGSYEIANILQNNKVDYLAVAFADEGIELRNAGITVPIVVMNPETGMMQQIFEHTLEPSIHNWFALEEFKRYCSSHPEAIHQCHIKIDTGMARYGFAPSEITQLVEELHAITNCSIRSVFSHLVGSDDSQFDAFTEQQISTFVQSSSHICAQFSYPILRHILNSAGIERFSTYQFDMVRLGIGLYGISATHENNCMHISTLKTFISEIRTMPAGTTVGYSRKGSVKRDSRIGVLPIGYADGLNRKLSNGVGTVIVNNTEVPIIGNICMDATMIDLTDVDAEIGDEVILFGKDLPITRMAEKLETIPYEIITSVSRRVKRLYYFE